MDQTASISAEAMALMGQGFSCSESIVLAVGRHLWGEVDPAMCRMSTAFSGGLGGTHEELCGALSGGAMIIGALHGRTDAAASADLCCALVTRYRSQFESVFGATICGDLRATCYGGGKTPCAVLVSEAAAVLLSVLADSDAA